MNTTVALTLASYLSMLFLGVASSLIGGAARNIGLDPFQIGLMIAAQNVGFMIAVLVSGTVSDVFEKPKILLFGSLLLASGFLAFYWLEHFWLNALIMLIIGLGIGTYEGVTDAMLLDLHQQKGALHININHFFVTTGSILITIYLIFLQVDWRRSITQSSLIVLLLAFIYAIFKHKPHKNPGYSIARRLTHLLKDRLVIVFFISTLIVVGIETGTVGILTTYLMDLRGFTQITSKIGLLLFLSGIAIGRIIIGALTPKHKTINILLGLLFMGFIVFGVMYFMDPGLLIYPIIFLAGGAISALLPLMLAYAGERHKGAAGSVLGIIKVAIPLGGILIPAAFAFVQKLTTFQITLGIYPIAFLTAFLVLLTSRNIITDVSDARV